MDLVSKEQALKYINSKFYIYGLFNPSIGKVFYVGKGTRKRMFEHEAKVNSKKIGNKHLVNTIKSLRSKRIPILYAIIYQTNNELLAYEKEKHFIKTFPSGLVNIHEGGRGRSVGKLEDTYGVEKAAEIRTRISTNRNYTSGEKHPLFKPLNPSIQIININGIEYYEFDCTNPDKNLNCRIKIRRKCGGLRTKSKVNQIVGKVICASCSLTGERNAMHSSKNHTNGMQGRRVKDIWIEKYGADKAEDMWLEYKLRATEASKGKTHSAESKHKMSVSNSKPKSEQGRLNIKLAAQARAQRQKDAKELNHYNQFNPLNHEQTK